MAIDDPIGGSDWNPKDRLGNDLEIPNSDRYHIHAIDGFGSIECLSIDPRRRNSPLRRGDRRNRSIVCRVFDLASSPALSDELRDV